MEPATLANIPTHVIAGPLGAGKTTLLQHLLQQRPAHERWAILINEFGQLGLDAALLEVDTRDGVSLAEIPGGCLCCVNGLPFQVGLQRLLRRSKPQRVLIETSGLGHPVTLLQQLQQQPWMGVLTMQPLVMVLDASALARGQPLPATQQAALPLAGCLLLNKSAQLTEEQRQHVLLSLPAVVQHWTEQAAIDWQQIPGAGAATPDQAAIASKPADPSGLRVLWRSRDEIHCQQQRQDEHLSMSWRLHPQQQLDRRQMTHWLGLSPWLRAKAIIHATDGWFSLNALPDSPLRWKPAAPANEQRLELIFGQPQDQQALTTALRQTLITG
ncbi:MAG: CobW-like GTP-binding protein [Gammaproteobacteria bacterium]|nr:CobW-like GTP-binding protein [Gammaproteobacteria bacterium]